MIITVLTKDRSSFTKATITSLLGHNKDAKNYTWIALDGASKDDTVEYLENTGLFTKIIKQKENTGLHPGMKELFENALNLDSKDEYLLHLENDWWSTRCSHFKACIDLLSEMEDTGLVQLREIEDENYQVRTWNPEYWFEGEKRIANLGMVDKGLFPINFFDQISKNGLKFILTDWHWVNQPTIMRRGVASKIFEGIDMDKKGSIEFQLMKKYYDMNLKTLRFNPGSMITTGFIRFGNKVARTPETKYK